MERMVPAGPGALLLDPYISHRMSRRRKRKRAEAVESVAPFRDRSAYALDAQLASLASAGDDTAFTALVTRFQSAVFRWSLIFARDPDEAEDIAQEVFVRVHRKIGDYRSDGPLEAWLYRLTRRTATQLRRKRGRRGRLMLSPAARPERDIYTTDPGARVDRQRAADVIRDMFFELPRRQREIFDLVDLQGLSPAEVAERTGMKPVSVRGNLFQARKAIRDGLLSTHPAYSEL